jgi:hypothetical protein
MDPATSTPTAALIGGAAVVVAGVTERVEVLDESVVEADCEGACDDVVLETDVDVDDAEEGEDDGGAEEAGDAEEGAEVEAEVEVDVMVVSVVENAEDAEDAEDATELAAEEEAELAAEDAAEGAAEDAELAAEDTAEEDPVLTAAVEEAVDTEIKLPPLLNKVTVAGCPLITTVDTVIVLCGPLAVLPTAVLPTLVCTVVFVV